MMKSGEEPAVKLEFLGGKLRKLGKRGGNITPVAPFFRPNKSTLLAAAAISAPPFTCAEQQEGQTFRDTPCVSVRKLAATLWELDNYNLPLAKMQNGGVGDPPPRLHNRLGGGFDPSPALSQLPGRSTNMRSQLTASLTQHHHPQVERRNRALEPASYGSSMEITPYNHVANPSSSVELKERTRDSNNLKTSTKLLKVLNRIWRLEEQHVCNMSLIRLLKRDLHQADSRIKELKQKQQASHHEMDELVTQIKQEKLLRKQEDHVRIETTIDSLRAELEEERKLKKRSEILHRNLAREVHDLKTTFTGLSKELENERKSHTLLEDLCDEFALGITEYEKELHAKKLTPEKNWDHNKLILHVSESWLDERMDMKLKTGDTAEARKSVLDKLRSEIEAFLRSKKESTLRRCSLESIPLNMAISAPRDDEDDDDSAANDFNCFELTKMNKSDINFQDKTLKEKQVKKKLEYPENVSGKKSRFEEQMTRASINHVEVKEELTTENSLEQSEAVKEGSSEGITGMNQNYMIENLIRHHYLSSDNGKKRSDKDYEAVSATWRNQQSPVRQWTTKSPHHDFEISESSSKLPQELKQNTLKEKLLEARTRGQKSRSRPKTATVSSSRNK